LSVDAILVHRSFEDMMWNIEGLNLGPGVRGARRFRIGVKKGRQRKGTRR